MGKGYDLHTILNKLQRPRGYQNGRIRPHPTKDKHWFAERYVQDEASGRKRWQPLEDEQHEFRLFTSPEDAQQALIDARGEPFTDNRPFYIRLAVAAPEEQTWYQIIVQAEKQSPGKLEEMIEDSSARLVAALRELRTCQSQKRANQLYEIILGHSNQMAYLAQYVHKEANRLRWFKINQKP